MSRTSVVCAALAVFCATGCQEKNVYQPPPPPEVTVAHPVEQTVEDVMEFSGVTEAVDRVEIRARVEGFLEEIQFTEGDMVQAGQPLFVIDPRPFQATLDAAEASLRVANARLNSAKANLRQSEARAANAEAEYNRAARAAVSGAVTESELDELRTRRDNTIAAIDVSRADIDMAVAEIAVSEAAVEQAKLDYSYTHILSPIAGRAGQRRVDIGNLVGSGESTLLTTVITHDPIYVTFTVSEADYLLFARRALNEKNGRLPTVEEDRKRVIRMGLSDEEGFPHIGRFNYADQSVDRATGTYMVRGVFPNPTRLIPPGVFVRVQAPIAEERVLLIDDVAIGRDQNGAYVTVVGEGDTVSRKRVRIGRVIDGQRVIKGGAETTDRVVVNGLQMARPGAKVRPKTAGPATPTQPAASAGG